MMSVHSAVMSSIPMIINATNTNRNVSILRTIKNAKTCRNAKIGSSRNRASMTTNVIGLIPKDVKLNVTKLKLTPRAMAMSCVSIPKKTVNAITQRAARKGTLKMIVSIISSFVTGMKNKNLAKVERR